LTFSGDCDVDSDCTGDLICFQRSSTEDPARDIPGCQGEYVGIDSNDYCYARPSPNYLHIIGNGLPAGSYGLCEGDCDFDDDCIGSLICQESSGLSEIEGCTGAIYPGQDYCREPLIVTAQPTPSPTNAPSTANPTPNPTTPNPTAFPTLPVSLCVFIGCTSWNCML